MFDKLDSVVQKYQHITDRLSSGEVDVKELQSLAKEQASLKEVVETYEQYKKNQNEIADNKEMLEMESDSEMKAMIKQDLDNLEKEVEELSQRLKILMIPKDPNDDKNIILEIRAGTGGDEAALFVSDLFRMYTRFAETKNWRVEIMSANETGQGGFKEVIALISGEQVYSFLKFESGIHRVQRVPTTESSGRIHTSAVSVAIMAEAEDVDVEVNNSDLRIDVMRAGGAGGQHVNTTDSAVRITHIPTNLVVICQDEKSQHKNKAKAMKVLKTRLLDLKISEQQKEESQARKAMVGSGDRSEKIRTYNFPQSRITDHRIGLTLHQLDDALSGNITPIVEALQASYQAEALKLEGLD